MVLQRLQRTLCPTVGTELALTPAGSQGRWTECRHEADRIRDEGGRYEPEENNLWIGRCDGSCRRHADSFRNRVGCGFRQEITVDARLQHSVGPGSVLAGVRQRHQGTDEEVRVHGPDDSG